MKTRTETTRALLPGEAPCQGCGQATPTPAVGDPLRLELQVGGTPDQHSASGRGFIPGQRGTIHVFGACVDCTPRDAAWAAWLPSDPWHAATLGVAARLLNVDGDPQEAVKVAGLTYARPADRELYALRYWSWVLHDTENRVGQCAVTPFSYVTPGQLAHLEQYRRDGLALKANADARADGRVLLTADAAGRLLDRRAAHVVTGGCGACGCKAQSAPVGSRVEDHWYPVRVPVSPLVHGVRKPGVAAGDVAMLLCSTCVGPYRESPSEGIGESYAADVLAALEIWNGQGWIPKGVLVSKLWGSQVLRARAYGRPEPVPSAARWAYLPKDENGKLARILPQDMPDAIGAGESALAAARNREQADADLMARAAATGQAAAQKAIQTDRQVRDFIASMDAIKTKVKSDNAKSKIPPKLADAERRARR